MREGGFGRRTGEVKHLPTAKAPYNKRGVGGCPHTGGRLSHRKATRLLMFNFEDAKKATLQPCLLKAATPCVKFYAIMPFFIELVNLYLSLKPKAREWGSLKAMSRGYVLFSRGSFAYPRKYVKIKTDCEAKPDEKIIFNIAACRHVPNCGLWRKLRHRHRRL